MVNGGKMRRTYEAGITGLMSDPGWPWRRMKRSKGHGQFTVWDKDQVKLARQLLGSGAAVAELETVSGGTLKQRDVSFNMLRLRMTDTGKNLAPVKPRTDLGAKRLY